MPARALKSDSSRINAGVSNSFAKSEIEMLPIVISPLTRLALFGQISGFRS